MKERNFEKARLDFVESDVQSPAPPPVYTEVGVYLKSTMS